MKLVYSWLKEFTDPGVGAAEVAKRLEEIGIEVNEVAAPGDKVSGVVIGKLTAVTKHENADRLFLCQVAIGDRTIQVVTAATNVAAGDTVPVALDGAELATGMKIKKRKMRGEVTEGMLCSTEELGLVPSPEGVWVITRQIEPGSDAVAALGLDEPVIDYEVPPNRGDLYGVLGMAREVAAGFRCELKIPELDYPEGAEDVRQAVEIGIAAPDLCERYAGTVVRGVNASSRAPFWMEQRLLLAGQRPLGLAVDVTNYILLEWGHPLHAFDLALLRGQKIEVRRAHQDEKAVTLDGVERQLNREMLVIADSERPVAVAGVMGCLGSGVTETTEDILLESAYFLPSSIRLTARALKHSTGASQVFERGSDRLGLLGALRRATGFLVAYGGGQACRGVYDVLPQPFTRTALPLRPERLSRVLGTAIEEKKMTAILMALGFECEAAADNTYKVTVPSWRSDIVREVDLIEEVARHHGYDQIAVQFPDIPSRTIAVSCQEQQRRRQEDFLVARGYQQVIAYAFHAPGSLLDEPETAVRLRNPLSPEMSVLRTKLLPGVLASLQLNFAYRSADILRLFETGRTFCRDQQGGLPFEDDRVALAVAGRQVDWRGGGETDFYGVKADVENLVRLAGMEPVFAAGEYPFLRPGCAAQITVGTREVGWLGLLAESIKERYDLRADVVVAELSCCISAHVVWNEYKPFSRQPAVERDLAFIVAAGVTVGTLREQLVAAGGEWLERLETFDLYRGKPLAADEKSVGFRFVFRAPDKTLTDDQVNEIMARIIKQLEKQVGARVRG